MRIQRVNRRYATRSAEKVSRFNRSSDCWRSHGREPILLDRSIT